MPVQICTMSENLNSSNILLLGRLYLAYGEISMNVGDLCRKPVIIHSIRLTPDDQKNCPTQSVIE
jgi:hypothetical protein